MCIHLHLHDCYSNIYIQLDMMAQILARRAEDHEVPGSSPARV